MEKNKNVLVSNKLARHNSCILYTPHLAPSNIMEILHHLCFLLAATLSSRVPTGTLLMRLSRKLQLFRIRLISLSKRFLCSFDRVPQIKNKMSLELSACIGKGCISFHMFSFCMLVTDCSQAKKIVVSKHLVYSFPT